jgi:hypothetical protein
MAEKYGIQEASKLLYCGTDASIVSSLGWMLCDGMIPFEQIDALVTMRSGENVSLMQIRIKDVEDWNSAVSILSKITDDQYAKSQPPMMPADMPPARWERFGIVLSSMVLGFLIAMATGWVLGEPTLLHPLLQAPPAVTNHP